VVIGRSDVAAVAAGLGLRRGDLAFLLVQVIGSLGIEVVEVDELPMMDDVRQSLLELLGH